MVSSRRARVLNVGAGAALAGVMLAQCDRPPAVEAPETAPVAAPPLPPPALGRAEMIAALARAASAHAAGQDTAEGLNGRRFSIRLPFGCHGPGQAAEPRIGLADASWSENRRTIQLRLTPANWLTAGPVSTNDLDPAWATAQGVWINRPWLAADTCPPRPPFVVLETPPEPSAEPDDDAAEAQATDSSQVPVRTPQSAGLILYAPVDGSRIGRRDGAPYVHSVRGDGEAAPVAPTHGWRVVLEGRIGAFPDGRSIRCRAQGLDERPVCVAAVQVDKVAFEDGDTGRQLAEWRPGG